jgi:predicted thioesterase
MGFPVYATPALIAHIEEAAIQCVKTALAPGQGTVGTRLDIQHIAATPIGMTVSVRAELSEVDGRRLVFNIEAHDEVEQIARGTHERFMINSIEKFVLRANQKAISSD